MYMYIYVHTCTVEPLTVEIKTPLNMDTFLFLNCGNPAKLPLN